MRYNIVFFNFISIFTVRLKDSLATDLDAKFEERALKRHQLDSLNLLTYVSLLILTILTVWLFKHRRFKFIHETGLAIIYGLIIGAIIKYSINGKTVDAGYVTFNSTSDPPTYLRLEVSDESNKSSYYQYEYHSQINKDAFAETELQEKATFDPEIFFNVILPPIIFNAGYQMKRRHFFKNIGAIMTFAFLGTLISALITGGLMYAFCLLIATTKISTFKDCLLFGAIISATDPVTVLAIFNDIHVDVDLHALVFGESILNDAVAIVLTDSIETYSASGFDGRAFFECLGRFLAVFFGSFFIGSTMGCITAFLTKYTKLKNFPLLETSLFVLMSYATFLAAESLKLTGIVAVLFCGICQAHYTYNNLSETSQNSTKELFQLLNFLMENFVFTYIGVSTFTFPKHSWDAGLIIFALLTVIIGRASNIYPLSLVINCGRSNKIPCKFQHVMMLSGLRGAMAFALAMKNTSTEARQTILTMTLIVVIVTVVLCGGLTNQLIIWLKIRTGIDEQVDQHNSSQPLHPNAGKAKIAQIWSSLDKRFIKPLLTHSLPPLTETLPSCCLPLSRLLTTNEQLMNTSNLMETSTSSDIDLLPITDEPDLAVDMLQA